MLQMYSKSTIIQHFQAYFAAHPLFFPKKHHLILILLRPQSYPDAPLVFSPYHGFQSWLEAMSGYLHNENNFFLKISAFCFVNSKNVFTFVHSSKFMSYGMYKCYSLAVKPRVTLSA